MTFLKKKMREFLVSSPMPFSTRESFLLIGKQTSEEADNSHSENLGHGHTAYI